jgi:type II secretory pathway predicted ATPase ExeA
MASDLVGEKLGNYRLEKLLGRGRMGVVYLARDEALLRPTAVKILSWSLPDATGHNPEAWFIAEARNVARVNHPNVVQIYSVARHGAHCYIAMEYVDGKTADAWIAQKGPFTAEQATELLIQVSGALQAAHDANVVHRDIKPENLLVGVDGKAKLGDFGMALHTGRTRATDNLRVGTPFYTAPEIWRGNVASVSTDIYALGAMYHYLLTGRPPFVTADLQELISAHLQSPIADLVSPKGSVPQGCQEIVRRCMAKTPQERYPSAQAVGWEARSQLKRLASIPPPSNSVSAPTGEPRILRVSGPVEPPSPRFTSIYGFERTPFSLYEPGQCPYQGPPFELVLAQLDAELCTDNSSVIVLSGASGTGRSCLIQELLQRLSYDGYYAYASYKNKQSVVKRALWTFGVPGLKQGPSNDDIDRLVEHCLKSHLSGPQPLIVIDDCDEISDSDSEILSLVQASQLTQSFRILLITTPDNASRFLKQSENLNFTASHVSVPRLSGHHVSSYVSSWFKATLAPNAAPILVTPDAILVVTHRSQGILARVNRLLTHMLTSGSLRRRRIFDSWDAWNASLEKEAPSELPRPEDWPTPEALELLNRYRQQLGMQLRR